MCERSSVPFDDLWSACCWDRTGVEVVAAGFRLGLYCINVVWLECVKALLVNVL